MINDEINRISVFWILANSANSIVQILSLTNFNLKPLSSVELAA